MSKNSRAGAALTLALLLLMSGCASDKRGISLILAIDSIGPMPLNREPTISIDYLKKNFPNHRITHEIRSGDSPDYHHFQVATLEGDVLFTIVSFLKENQVPSIDQRLVAVPIDLLKIVSPTIPDEHGIRVGNRVADVIRARGENLDFGAAHFDVYVGGSQIFYNLRTGSDWSPEDLTLADAKRANWEVASISWPTGAWE